MSYSKPPAADTYTLGTRVRPDRDSSEAIDELVAEGWQEVGDGVYTRVLLSPDGSRVLKFADGTGQRATVEAALANPDNPHLPRVFGLIDLGDYFEFAYESEPLEPLEDDEDDLYARDWEGDEDYAQPEFKDWRKRWSPDRLQVRPELFKGRPNGPMKDAVRALISAQEQHFGYVGWDIHPGNVMRRPSDGALVLNDLLA